MAIDKLHYGQTYSVRDIFCCHILELMIHLFHILFKMYISKRMQFGVIDSSMNFKRLSYIVPEQLLLYRLYYSQMG